MRYFLVRTTAGTVEVLASDARDAISKAQQWAGRYGETVQGIENSENGGVDSATGMARGNDRPVASPNAPAIGFTRQQAIPSENQSIRGAPTQPVGRLTQQGQSVIDDILGRTNQPTNFENAYATETDLPRATFRSFLRDRTGISPEGTLGQFAQNYYAPAYATSVLGPLLGTVPQNAGFQGFLNQRGLGGITPAAAETFKALAQSLPSADNGLLGEYQNPTVTDPEGRLSGTAADVYTLAKSAVAQQYSPFVAANLVPSGTTLGQRYQQQLLKQQEKTPSFVDFLQKQFNLKY